jgi:hypothetical protein
VARGFAEPDVARNDGGVDPILEERPDVLCDLLTQVRPLVIHRQQDAGDVETGVEGRPHASKGRDQIGEPFERKVFTVQRDKDRIGGD